GYSFGAFEERPVGLALKVCPTRGGEPRVAIERRAAWCPRLADQRVRDVPRASASSACSRPGAMWSLKDSRHGSQRKPKRARLSGTCEVAIITVIPTENRRWP